MIMPVARLERQWPGGPVKGTFTARYGPDNLTLGSFELTAADSANLPAMLGQAVQRLDRIYSDAGAAGTLRINPTLSMDHASIDPAVAGLLAAADRVAAAQAAASPIAEPTIAAASASEAVMAITVQFASPDARAVDTALASVRSVPGVSGAGTTSLAMGGTSVMRVMYSGSLDELAGALKSRGWSVVSGSNALSIKR